MMHAISLRSRAVRRWPERGRHRARHVELGRTRPAARTSAAHQRCWSKRETGYQATIQVMGGLRAYVDPEYPKMPAIPRVISAALLGWFNSPDGNNLAS
jgi:hypothetical protein